jgi:hypothetical protein
LHRRGEWRQGRGTQAAREVIQNEKPNGLCTKLLRLPESHATPGYGGAAAGRGEWGGRERDDRGKSAAHTKPCAIR